LVSKNSHHLPKTAESPAACCAGAVNHIPFVVLAILSMVLSLALCFVSLKEIPVGHAYFVWLAVGAISISVVNHYFSVVLFLLFSAYFCGCYRAKNFKLRRHHVW
jgi:hypothetical protein